MVVDGEVVFSKAKAGRFPVENEVEELFAALKPGARPSDAASPKQQGSRARAGVLGRLTGKFRK